MVRRKQQLILNSSYSWWHSTAHQIPQCTNTHTHTHYIPYATQNTPHHTSDITHSTPHTPHTTHTAYHWPATSPESSSSFYNCWQNTALQLEQLHTRPESRHQSGPGNRRSPCSCRCPPGSHQNNPCLGHPPIPAMEQEAYERGLTNRANYE